jgi:hypothetical protein
MSNSDDDAMSNTELFQQIGEYKHMEDVTGEYDFTVVPFTLTVPLGKWPVGHVFKEASFSLSDSTMVVYEKGSAPDDEGYTFQLQLTAVPVAKSAKRTATTDESESDSDTERSDRDDSGLAVCESVDTGMSVSMRAVNKKTRTK